MTASKPFQSLLRDASEPIVNLVVVDAAEHTPLSGSNDGLKERVVLLSNGL